MKKVIMLLGFAMFSVATFAAKSVVDLSNPSTVSVKNKTRAASDKVASIIDKYKADNNVTNISMDDDGQGYTLIKIEFRADCPGWYSVVAVLTIKVWDDGCVEFFPWFQDDDLVCS